MVYQIILIITIRRSEVFKYNIISMKDCQIFLMADTQEDATPACVVSVLRMYSIAKTVLRGKEPRRAQS